MKISKIIGIGLGSLLFLLIVGGYIFFQIVFRPDPNTLSLSEKSGPVPITWIESEHSDISALLLPIHIEGISKSTYMQFDTGTPSTLFYKGRMRAIQEKYKDLFGAIDSTSIHVNLSFKLGEMTIHSDQFKLYDYGDQPINWADSSGVLIGTLGADMIEKKLTIMDFINHECYFGNDVSVLPQKASFYPIIFRKRKLLIPSIVVGKKGNLIHDTGTSGFELITNKKTWQKLARQGADPEEAFKVKSWKRQLTAFNIASQGKIHFEPMEIGLSKVTYIEGASFMQHALMWMLRMGGMIGNEIFMDKILVLDCQNKRYAVLDTISP